MTIVKEKPKGKWAPLEAGAAVGHTLGRHPMHCFRQFEVGGTEHWHFIAPQLKGVKFRPDMGAMLEQLKLPGQRRLAAAVLLPMDILSVRKHEGIHAAPFHPSFPNDWSTASLMPDYRIEHASLAEWIDIAGQLTPDMLAAYVTQENEGVWCGASWLRHTDDRHASSFRLRPEKRGVLLEHQVMSIPPVVGGYVMFVVSRWFEELPQGK